LNDDDEYDDDDDDDNNNNNNRILRLFGPKRNEVIGELRKLHNRELNDLYSSPNIFHVIKLRRIRLVGHIARMEREEAYTGFWWGNLRQREYLEVPGVDGRMICSWSFRKWNVGVWTGSSWLGKGTGGSRL
jgi:hypothetical protein